MKGSVRKRGDKWSYYFSYKQDGKYKKKEKGGFATKREASSALREALHVYENNNIINQFNSYTLYDYIKYWLETEGIRTLKGRSLQLYQSINENHIKNEIGFLKLTEINHITLYKFLEKKQVDYSSRYVGTMRIVLNNSFNFAIKEGIIHFNPLSNVKLNPKGYNTSRLLEARVLTLDEIDTLLDAAKGTRYYLPILISVQMGLRRSEVLALTWDDVDFKKKTLSVNKILTDDKKRGLLITSPKTESSNRILKMTKDVIDILKVYKEHQKEMKKIYGDSYYSEYDFIYCRDNGTPISPNNSFTPSFRSFLKNHVPFHFRFHDLRHTHATLLLESGVNPKVIQDRLGHADIRTTLNIYSHVTEAMVDDSVEKFEKLIG